MPNWVQTEVFQVLWRIETNFLHKATTAKWLFGKKSYFVILESRGAQNEFKLRFSSFMAILTIEFL